MNSKRVFRTESIDLAAFLTTAGHLPKIIRNPSGNRAVFVFVETPELRSDVLDYERGATLPGKRLLNVRSWLFREASRVCREVTQ